MLPGRAARRDDRKMLVEIGPENPGKCWREHFCNDVWAPGANFDPILAKCRPNAPHIGQMLAAFYLNWFEPHLVDIWPMLVDFGVRRPDSAPKMPPRAFLEQFSSIFPHCPAPLPVVNNFGEQRFRRNARPAAGEQLFSTLGKCSIRGCFPATPTYGWEKRSARCPL